MDRSYGSCLWDRYCLWVVLESGVAAKHKGVAAMGLHGLSQAAAAIHIP